jgi:hypothetical protein
MSQDFQDKLLELLRIKFNLYHANCIISLLTDDSVDVKTFVEEIKKMMYAEQNDIDEYDNPNICSD